MFQLQGVSPTKEQVLITSSTGVPTQYLATTTPRTTTLPAAGLLTFTHFYSLSHLCYIAGEELEMYYKWKFVVTEAFKKHAGIFRLINFMILCIFIQIFTIHNVLIPSLDNVRMGFNLIFNYIDLTCFNLVLYLFNLIFSPGMGKMPVAQPGHCSLPATPHYALTHQTSLLSPSFSGNKTGRLITKSGIL